MSNSDDGNAEMMPIIDEPRRNKKRKEPYAKRLARFITDKKIRRKAKVLQKLNLAAGIVHLLSGVALVIVAIIFRDDAVRTELTTDFKVFSESFTGPATAGQLELQSKSLGFYPVVWVDIPFPFITAAFHLVLALSQTYRNRYNAYVFAEGRNPYRWREYAITASLMTWVICQLSGITNIFLLIMIAVVANIALQFTGEWMERTNHDLFGLRKRAKHIDWVPTAVGWIIFLGQWSTILTYFFTAISSPRPEGVEQVPVFVYLIVIGLFFQFAVFGFTLFIRFYYQCNSSLNKAYNSEIMFILLSFTSKLFLTWTLQIGTIMQ